MGSACSARAGGAVLACYNMMIPYLCPELPPAQKAALHSLVKTPLVYTSVALRNWQAFDRAEAVTAFIRPGKLPQLFLSQSARHHRHATRGRSHPAIRSSCTWCAPLAKQDCRSTSRIESAGRNCSKRRLRRSSATYETSSAAPLKDGGFDPALDITAITVNRWPHGYAPEYNPLFDPELPDRISSPMSSAVRTIRPDIDCQLRLRRRGVYGLRPSIKAIEPSCGAGGKFARVSSAVKLTRMSTNFAPHFS